MNGISRTGQPDFRNKETGALYELIGKVYRKGHLRWVVVNLETGREILLTISKMERYFEKLW